jgi:hypothetical protein
VIAPFVDKANKKPLSGRDLMAKLYDKDIGDDDFLGQAMLDNRGMAEILADLDDASSPDNPLEAYPDLYFVLQNQAQVIFKSRVFENVDFLKKNKVSKERLSQTQDLGTFEV